MSACTDGWPADWLVPDWPVPPWVRAVCTTRSGGVSGSPWDGMNLGDHVGDDPAAVHANRDRLAAYLQAQPVFLQQVHGHTVVNLAQAEGAAPLVADACITCEPGIACTVMVADCLPVLLANIGLCRCSCPCGLAGAGGGWRAWGHRGIAGSPGSPA